MALVTFLSSVGGDNSVVTDDANVSTGLANGGHRSRFIPALAQLVAVAANAVSQAAAALVSKNSAATSETNAGNSATNAAASFTAADKKYLGAYTANPTLDNQGAALATGAWYFNTASAQTRIWSGSAWVVASFIPTAASGVSLTPTGYVSSTNVQAGIAEIAAKQYTGDTLFLHQNFGGF